MKKFSKAIGNCMKCTFSGFSKKTENVIEFERKNLSGIKIKIVIFSVFWDFEEKG